MRDLTDQIVPGKMACHHVIAVDEPGDGGACHKYSICVPNGDPGDVILNFQNGPITEAGDNGIQHEDLLAVVLDRLRGFQSGKFSCRENAIAITKLEEALMWLKKRTMDRVARGIEGTHGV